MRMRTSLAAGVVGVGALGLAACGQTTSSVETVSPTAAPSAITQQQFDSGVLKGSCYKAGGFFLVENAVNASNNGQWNVNTANGSTMTLDVSASGTISGNFVSDGGDKFTLSGNYDGASLWGKSLTFESGSMTFAARGSTPEETFNIGPSNLTVSWGVASIDSIQGALWAAPGGAGTYAKSFQLVNEGGTCPTSTSAPR